MKIVFIGAGNLATNLAKALFKAGNDIIQVYSRTETSARMLAEKVDAEALTDVDRIVDKADLYVLSVLRITIKLSFSVPELFSAS